MMVDFKCVHPKSKVLETRQHFRRRECLECKGKFWTEETIVENPNVWKKKKKKCEKPAQVFQAAVDGYVLIDGKMLKIQEIE